MRHSSRGLLNDPAECSEVARSDFPRRASERVLSGAKQFIFPFFERSEAINVTEIGRPPFVAAVPMLIPGCLWGGGHSVPLTITNYEWCPHSTVVITASPPRCNDVSHHVYLT